MHVYVGIAYRYVANAAGPAYEEVDYQDWTHGDAFVREHMKRVHLGRSVKAIMECRIT